MRESLRNHTILLFLSAASAAVSGCTPKYVSAADLGYTSDHNHSAYTQQGYTSGAYYQAAQYTLPASRYGATAGSRQMSLRPACNEYVAPCGFMRVVPIYPIYQVAVQPEPIAEVPTVTLPEAEPAPVITYEPAPTPIPEPVYSEPAYHWPEPETDMPSWKPLRK
jgi:hypothetical protein